MGKIAALLTCYNRKAKTRDCLTSLFKIVSDIDVYLVDDASSDGTADMVRTEFPQVKLIEGTGSLFWNRGMHRAWSEALKADYDFYLWLNDDVVLYPYFLDELFECYAKAGEMSVITGIIIDKDTKAVIYGGTDASNKLHKIDGEMHQVRDMNGNVVLVPRCVVKKIGIIDPHFIQGGGDTDYGYTARRNGIGVFTTTKAVALGYANRIDRLRKWNTNIAGRYRYLYSPFGMKPELGFYFFNKHFGLIKAIEYWVYLHLINILPDCLAEKLHPRN